MNEMREMSEKEMEQVEGGMTMQWFLDNWLGAMTGGLVGYGPNGVTGPYETAYKNKYVPGGP